MRRRCSRSHRPSALVMIRLPNLSTVARKPGNIGTVDPNSWITAGPSTTSPAPSSARSWMLGVQPSPPKYTGLVPIARRDPRRAQAISLISGLRDRTDAGHPEIDPFHRLVGFAAEVVAVQRPMRVVECTDHRVGPAAGDRHRPGRAPAPRRPDRCSAGRGPFDDLCSRRETLRAATPLAARPVKPRYTASSGSRSSAASGAPRFARSRCARRPSAARRRTRCPGWAAPERSAMSRMSISRQASSEPEPPK